MTRFLALAAALTLLVGGGLWYYQTYVSPPAQGADLLPAGAAAAQTTAGDLDTSQIVEMQIGNPDAAVTLIEYASFTCPHCASFHEDAFKELKADYIDTGKINFIYREVYFDRPGLWASMIARCGGPERFFGITDLIYAGQSEWTRSGDFVAIADELRKIGRLAGIDREVVDNCMADANKAQTLVAWYQQNAEEHGISSTPAFVLNGRRHGNMSYSELAGLIEDELN